MLVVAGPGLRETKRAETERRLAAIAFALVAERGFAHVTVDDIVEEARVSRRTFSNYYACKEEAVAAVIVHDAADGLAGWSPAAVADGAGHAGGSAGLVDLVRGLVGHQFDAGVLARLVELADLSSAHRQLVPYVREAQWRLWSMAGEHALEGGGHDDTDREVELDALLGAVFGVVSAQLSRRTPENPLPPPEPERIRALVDGVLDRLAGGLAAGGPPA